MNLAVLNDLIDSGTDIQREEIERQRRINSRTPDTVQGAQANARRPGQQAQQQAQNVFQSTQQQAQGYGQQAAGFGASVPMLAGGAFQAGGTPQGAQPVQPQQAPGIQQGDPYATVPIQSMTPEMASRLAPRVGANPVPGGTYDYQPQQAQAAPQQAQQPAFNLGAQAGQVAGVDPSQLGSVGASAGQLGGGPQLGGLGGAPSVAQVGNIAGQLGGAPQVGNVGNISMGAAPGNIAGTFGNLGQDSSAQQGFLGRINQFLDTPDGPSVAAAQLEQAQVDNASQLIGAARSGRGGAGSQAAALRGALSEGSALMSNTAGQMATLRAQEEDMRRNRQLSAMGLGGNLAGQMRGQDLSFRGQDLQAAMSDQGTQLGARGQDLQGAMADQSTQTALEQLRASTALGARGQDLGALQSDQATQAALAQARGQLALGARGQDASMLQSQGQLDLGARGQDLQSLLADQSAQVAMRGQNLGALQGNQQAALGLEGMNVQRRGQDLGALQGDQNAALAAQQLALQGQLGLGGLGLQAQGQGLGFQQQANQQALAAEAMAQAANQGQLQRQNALAIADRQAANQQNLLQQQLAAQPDLWEQILVNSIGGLAQGGGKAIMGAALSDERAKENIRPVDSLADHLRGAPGYRYRYREGVGEDPGTEHVGPMAQDLEAGPFGQELVETGGDGYKRVRTDRLALVNHAGLASLLARIDALEAA